jgi:hypothetical protein
MQPNGLYLKQCGDVRLAVEKVGTTFRVLVTHVVDEMRPDEVVYAGTAASLDDDMAIAEQGAAQVSAQIRAHGTTP